MGKDHSTLSFRKFTDIYPFKDGYPIHTSQQCLSTYPNTKDVWEIRMSQIMSQLDIYRGDVEDISRDLESSDVLEVIVGSGDSKQKLLQDLKQMSILINSLRSSFGNIRSQLTTHYNKFVSADEIELEKYKQHQLEEAQKQAAALKGSSSSDSIHYAYFGE